MGRPFLLKFDRTPVNEFYMCRKCQTHIALEQEQKFNDANDNELKGPIFRNVINWYSLEEEPTRTIGDFVVAEIFCNNCGYPLGLQFIEILEDLENLVKENYFLLHLSKLLKWDGYQIVDPFQVEVGPNPVEVEHDEPNLVEVEDDEVGPNPVEVEDPNPVEVEDDEVGPNPVEVEDPNPVEVEDPNPVEVEDDEVGPNPVEVEDDGDDDDN